MSNTSSKVHDQLIAFGITPHSIHRNLPVEKLVEQSIETNEGMLTSTGSLSVKTGKYTGRSPQDRYIIYDDETHETIDWGDVNRQFPTEKFNSVFEKMKKHAEGKDLYIFDGFVGADKENRLAIRVVNDHAWQNLFCRQLFVRPSNEELESHDPDFTIVCLNDFETIPEIDGTRTNIFILVNLSKKIVLIGGTNYAGEMKKSMFAVMNYLMPKKDVFPMHCSANIGKEGDTALFFGLSGTGKTSLSADPERMLIGDDEHGWSQNGVFNFEGGCYAKMIRLSEKAEPEIYQTTKLRGTILENVVIDKSSGEIDLDDSSLAENTRGAYPLSFIPNASETGRTCMPKNIILLTCDAFGVLPPIAKLSASQTMYHFLSGYTAKVAGTEKGVTEPEATFSACFGAPFMPRHPSEYGKLLQKLIAEHSVKCWLVNTGWTGGPYGIGERMPIGATRKLLSSALTGSLLSSEMRIDENFCFEVPSAVEGVDRKILNPRETWEDKEDYDLQAQKLVKMFSDNFDVFKPYVDIDIIDAAPNLQAAE